jgi:hypothetical protein
VRKGTLNRIRAKSGDAGTFSNLAVLARDGAAAALALVAGELPARANQVDLSCLAPMPGDAPITYLLKYQWSAAHGCNKYTVVGVLLPDGTVGPVPGGRLACEVHAANIMGDILKQLAAQLEGCIAPGLAFAVFPAGEEFYTFTEASPTKLVLAPLGAPQLGVSSSGAALAAFEKELAGEDLALTVAWI